MEMENQLRRITGQYEEAMYRLTQVNRRLERALEDMEFRVQQLEQQAAGVLPPGGQEGGLPPSEVVPPASQAAQASQGQPQDGVAVLLSGETSAAVDSVTARPPATLTPPGQVPVAADATPETQPAQFVQGTTPEEHFAGAFTLLRRDALEGAENAFRAFLTLHPDHALAANAKYWLGKTYFARGDFDAAARTMLEGYQAHADSDKGPDILLHLGLSLNQIGQQQDACAAFDELAARYPDADVAVTQRAVTGRRAAGCA
ncbi:MAG: tol-pal system protein YbgF [Alphaproteobacteria bacterium]